MQIVNAHIRAWLACTPAQGGIKDLYAYPAEYGYKSSMHTSAHGSRARVHRGALMICTHKLQNMNTNH